HSRLVADLAVALFDQTQHLHRLGAPERELLYFSGLLHDVGTAVAQSAHHKHSLYIIGNADIECFSDQELRLIANIARYHRKALPSQNHVDYTSLGASAPRGSCGASALCSGWPTGSTWTTSRWSRASGLRSPEARSRSNCGRAMNHGWRCGRSSNCRICLKPSSGVQ